MLPLSGITCEVLRQCFRLMQHGVLLEPLDIDGICSGLVGKNGGRCTKQ
jgi:hypothetical protein